MPASPPAPPTDVAFSDIEAARARVRDAVFESPCAYTETLSKRTGCNVWLKLENLQSRASSSAASSRAGA